METQHAKDISVCRYGNIVVLDAFAIERGGFHG
jgi:hypothetical protein